MKEFGSDFHRIAASPSGSIRLTGIYPNSVMLASGRQCIVALVKQYGWRRLWIPDLFCHDVIDSIRRQTGVEIALYADNPLFECRVEQLPFKAGDALLRMNFFGMRGIRSNEAVPVPVIEDHSHDPLGLWARGSNADWCISSIRKTLPLPEGGLVWSPKGYVLSPMPGASRENEAIAAERWRAMEQKTLYLENKLDDKEGFRRLFVETEEWFDHSKPVTIDERSRTFISDSFDIGEWQNAKRRNWHLLEKIIDRTHCNLLKAEDDACTMFSLVLMFPSKERRNEVRSKLIGASVYPAVLWAVPDDVTVSAETKCFSEQMLSVHCDGRYSGDDARQMASILNLVLEE